MKSLIKKGINTLKNDGLAVFFVRIWSFSVVKLKRCIEKKDIENYAKWKKLHNCFKGERIFIIGNGPSLNETPLYLLENEYTMCFNRFNLMFERINWKPDFYCVTDDLVIKDMASEINREILPNVNFAFFPDIHPSNVDFRKFIVKRENVLWLNTDSPQFKIDLPNCGINKTVVNAGMQVAAYLGFSEIYLIGVDATFGEQKVKKLNSRNWVANENDPNHFDPRYFSKGRSYHNPTVDEMFERFNVAKVFFDKLNVKIFNAGVGGKLEVFPRVDFNSLFDYTLQEIEALLLNSNSLKNHGITFTQLNNSEKIHEVKREFPMIFQSPFREGLTLIPKVINDFIPIGPYNNTFYFIRKEKHLLVKKVELDL